MLPKIKKMEFMNVHIDDEIHKDNDVILTLNGVEKVDASHSLTKKEFDEMMLHDPSVAILGIGFRGKVKIERSVIDAAKKNSIELHILPTPEASKKFQELARKGEKVVAKLHITC